MRIAFLIIGNSGRSGPLNGYNIRYGGTGCSGTESSVIYVAEYLSKNGFDVTISLEKCDTPNESNGVFYTNFNFDGQPNKEFDFLVSALWFVDYNKLPIKVTNSLIYWYHLAWGYGYDEMMNYVKNNNLKMGTVSVSQWAKKENDTYSPFFKKRDIDVIESIIPNPVDGSLFDETLNKSIERKKHKVVFHAQWSRGGDVAKRACLEMGWGDLEFKSFDYINTIGGIDKTKLFNEIASSEYFIFPLLTHGKLVYQDTFSLSVAEAIGLGTTVLTYPLGGVTEHFGNYCHFIDFPNDVNMEELSKQRVFEEPKFNSTDKIVSLINRLESNPDLKEKKKIDGISYVKNTFDINKIGPMWIEYLNYF